MEENRDAIEKNLSRMDPAPAALPAAPQIPPRVSVLVDVACSTAIRRARGEETPLPTPWGNVNAHLFGGLWPGLYTITSGTGVGKTQAALQCAIHAAKHIRAERDARGETDDPEGRGEVLYVALELGPVDVGARTLGLLTEGGRDPLAWRDMFYGQIAEDAVTQAAADYHAALAALPFRVACVAARGLAAGVAVRTPAHLAEIAARMKPRMVVLDYTQLLDSDNPRDDARIIIKEAAIVGRELARDGAAVLFISSTARSNYGALTGDEKEPTLGTGDAGRLVGLGKEAGELEYCADVALALALDPTDDTRLTGGNDRGAWLAIAKGRGVDVGWLPLMWNGRRFRDPSPNENAAAWSRVSRTEDERGSRGRPKKPEPAAPSSNGNSAKRYDSKGAV